MKNEDDFLVVHIRKDGAAKVSTAFREWETSGHQITLQTPAGGLVQVTWPGDFAPELGMPSDVHGDPEADRPSQSSAYWLVQMDAEKERAFHDLYGADRQRLPQSVRMFMLSALFFLQAKRFEDKGASAAGGERCPICGGSYPSGNCDWHGDFKNRTVAER